MASSKAPRENVEIFKIGRDQPLMLPRAAEAGRSQPGCRFRAAAATSAVCREDLARIEKQRSVQAVWAHPDTQERG